MTIPKRNKRRKKGEKFPLPVKLKEVMKDIQQPNADKMVRNFPRVCPKCGRPSYSTLCQCGRLTVLTK